MSREDRLPSRIRQVAALVAIVFGVATLVAGGSVLSGRDPGYEVYLPLVLFKTVIGAAYVVAGFLMWRWSPSARLLSALIVAASAVALALLIVRSRAGPGVAGESLRVMTFRTVVWLVLLLALLWSEHTRRAAA